MHKLSRSLGNQKNEILMNATCHLLWENEGFQRWPSDAGLIDGLNFKIFGLIFVWNDTAVGCLSLCFPTLYDAHFVAKFLPQPSRFISDSLSIIATSLFTRFPPRLELTIIISFSCWSSPLIKASSHGNRKWIMEFLKMFAVCWFFLHFFGLLLFADSDEKDELSRIENGSWREIYRLSSCFCTKEISSSIEEKSI